MNLISPHIISLMLVVIINLGLVTSGASAEDESYAPIGIFLDLHRRDFRKEPIEQWTRTLQGLQGLGVDTVVAKVNDEMLRRAELLQMRVITGANWDKPERTRQWEKYGSLLAWLGTDEPGRTDQVDQAKAQYAMFREVASRPLAVSLYLPEAYPHANDLADILLPDPYIFGHARRDGTYYEITEIPDRISALRSQLNQEKRMWAVPQLYAWHPFFKRPPTPDELEAETIYCLGEGAQGILYFALNSGHYYPNPPDFDPIRDDEKPLPWNLYDHPELLRRLRKMNKITRHVLYQFGGRAEKQSLPEGAVRYTWRRDSDAFSAEVHLKPELHVTYTF